MAAPAPTGGAAAIFHSDFEDLQKMAEQEGANGAGDQAAGAADTLPQVGVIAQYVKDLSFVAGIAHLNRNPFALM